MCPVWTNVSKILYRNLFLTALLWVYILEKAKKGGVGGL